MVKCWEWEAFMGLWLIEHYMLASNKVVNKNQPVMNCPHTLSEVSSTSAEIDS